MFDTAETFSQDLVKNNTVKTSNTIPTLLGSKVTLRAFEEQDITPEYIQWLNDIRVTRYSEQRHKIHTFESCKSYFNDMQNNKHYFWAIMANDSNVADSASSMGMYDSSQKHIGNLTAYIDRNNKTADLAIMIGDLNVQNKGFGKEAWILASDYLLNNQNIRKITAGTMAKNIAMLKVMQASGMTQEGCREKQFLLEGEEVDLIFMARFSNNEQASLRAAGEAIQV